MGWTISSNHYFYTGGCREQYLRRCRTSEGRRRYLHNWHAGNHKNFIVTVYDKFFSKYPAFTEHVKKDELGLYISGSSVKAELYGHIVLGFHKRRISLTQRFGEPETWDDKKFIMALRRSNNQVGGMVAKMAIALTGEVVPPVYSHASYTTDLVTPAPSNKKIAVVLPKGMRLAESDRQFFKRKGVKEENYGVVRVPDGQTIGDVLVGGHK